MSAKLVAMRDAGRAVQAVERKVAALEGAEDAVNVGDRFGHRQDAVFFADFLQELNAVHFGHLNIQCNDIWVELPNHFSCD
mgnify:CR=1 FL=1